MQNVLREPSTADCYYLSAFGRGYYLSAFGRGYYLSAFGRGYYLSAFGRDYYLSAFGRDYDPAFPSRANRQLATGDRKP
jgi:hypothetical protein